MLLTFIQISASRAIKMNMYKKQEHTSSYSPKSFSFAWVSLSRFPSTDVTFEGPSSRVVTRPDKYSCQISVTYETIINGSTIYQLIIIIT